MQALVRALDSERESRVQAEAQLSQATAAQKALEEAAQQVGTASSA